MIYLYIRQTVRDAVRWKESFDMLFATRQAGGAAHEALVLRNLHEPHEIVLVLGWHDVAQAQLFTRSVSWQMALAQMGVVGVPEVLFLECAFR